MGHIVASVGQAIGPCAFSSLATTREWLAAPRIGYRMSDSVTAYLGAEIFSGPPGTLFGLVEELLSAGYGELRATF